MVHIHVRLAQHFSSSNCTFALVLPNFINMQINGNDLQWHHFANLPQCNFYCKKELFWSNDFFASICMNFVSDLHLTSGTTKSIYILQLAVKSYSHSQVGPGLNSYKCMQGCRQEFFQGRAPRRAHSHFSLDRWLWGWPSTVYSCLRLCVHAVVIASIADC